MQYLTATVSRTGYRPKNQDRLAVFNNQDSVLLALGDGLGGRPSGEFAAQTLIDTAAELFQHQSAPIREPIAFLQELIALAHTRIIQGGKNQNPPINPGTTAVLCLIQEGFAWWTHVGDSRLYLFREGEMVDRTLDHSVLGNLLAGGHLDPGDTDHPMRNVITRCLGLTDNQPIISLSKKTPLKAGDIMLLCSDGFWEPLNEGCMARDLFEGKLQDTLNALAEQAEKINAPQSDNISAIALQVMSLKLRTRSIPTQKTPHPNSFKPLIR